MQTTESERKLWGKARHTYASVNISNSIENSSPGEAFSKHLANLVLFPAVVLVQSLRLYMDDKTLLFLQNGVGDGLVTRTIKAQKNQKMVV
jgi:hypothetical protein